jgi:hypothetical protein
MRRPMPAVKTAHAAIRRGMRIVAEAARAMGMAMQSKRILEMLSRTMAILNGAVLSPPRWLAVTLLGLTALAVTVRGDRGNGWRTDHTPTIAQARPAEKS